MATFVLIPGAGGHAAYWNRLIPELETRGQGAIAVDIEENDPSMDLDGFAAVVEAAMGEYADVILGMDVISIGSLAVEGNGTFSFSF